MAIMEKFDLEKIRESYGLSLTQLVFIKEHQFLSWDFPLEKLRSITMDLQEQVGDEYVVLVPGNTRLCILVLEASRPDIIRGWLDKGYTRAEKHIL